MAFVEDRHFGKIIALNGCVLLKLFDGGFMFLSKNKTKIAMLYIVFVCLVFPVAFANVIFNKNVVLSTQSLPVISYPQTHKRVHAATISEISKDHVIAAYFGGTDEGHPDVKIWLSHGYRDANDMWNWEKPFVVASPDEIPRSRHKACYNPVLFKFDEKTTLLFFKVGKLPTSWKGYLKRSFDGGMTWSKAEDLSRYGKAVGPTRCKPIRLNNNSILCGSSDEGLVNWQVHMEKFNFYPNSSNISSIEFSKRIETPHNFVGHNRIRKDKKTSKLAFLNRTGIIQPTPFFTGKNPREIKIVCRGKATRYLVSSVSKDSGRTWSPVKQEESLINAGGSCGSGLDSVRLKNGDILIVRNDLPYGIKNKQRGDRSKLVLDISKDQGVSWRTVLVLEETSVQEGKQNCYPSIIQADDGLVHVVYTFDKCGNENRIKHVVLDPEKLN